MPNFDLIKHLKLCLQKTMKLGTLARLSCLISLLKTGKKLFSYEKVRRIKVWRRLGGVMTKNLFAQTISDKNLEQSKKLLPIDIYCLISGRETGL